MVSLDKVEIKDDNKLVISHKIDHNLDMFITTLTYHDVSFSKLMKEYSSF